MSFVSQDHEFLFFVGVVLTAYFLAAWRLSGTLSHRVQNAILVTASYVFYGWWDMRLLFLIVTSTVVDFVAGLMIERGRLSKSERLWAVMALPAAAVAFVGIDWVRLAHLIGRSDSDGASVTDAIPLLEFGSLAQSVAGAAVLAVVLGQLGSGRLKAASASTRRRLFLGLSVAANLAILGFFKYFNFFAGSLADLATSVGVTLDRPTLDILLPVGISFYTFQTMGYTIDVYRGGVKAVDQFPDFMLYVCYFPQLVMGPIERAAQLLPQITQPREVRIEQVVAGLQLALWGYFKKAVIADNVAGIVDQTFADPSPPGWSVILAVYAFAIQIYCDFSGYTDIGRGVSRVLGIELRLNFRLPYFAVNPSDFWQRWHISLSTWLRDYLYIPLGGNRFGTWKTYRNLAVTMLLGGLWHGAAWNFVAWGAFHGALLIVFRLFESPGVSGAAQGAKRTGIVFWLQAMLFFQVTCVGWLLFRSPSLGQASDYAWGVFASPGFELIDWSAVGRVAAYTTPLLAVQLVQHYRNEPEFWRYWPLTTRIVSGLVVYYGIVFLQAPKTYPFIYFQF